MVSSDVRQFHLTYTELGEVTGGSSVKTWGRVRVYVAGDDVNGDVLRRHLVVGT